jgi:type III pantothenate kinase
MSTSICFDFGNTRLKAAIFNNHELLEVIVLNDGSLDEIGTLLNKFKPQKTILSSVIHHDKNLELLLAQKSEFHLLGPSTIINFTTPVGKPLEPTV